MEVVYKKKWVEAMQDEVISLHKNNIFELVKVPTGKKALKNMLQPKEFLVKSFGNNDIIICTELPRDNLEECCSIAGMAIPST